MTWVMVVFFFLAHTFAQRTRSEGTLMLRRVRFVFSVAISDTFR